MKSYPEVDFPLTKPFSEMSKKEARHYFDWFISSIPARIKIMTDEIHSILHSTWNADKSRESVTVVAEWLEKTASYRNVSKEERLAEIERKNLKGRHAEYAMEVTKLLDHETKLRCFDAGMYIGETMIKSSDIDLKWLFNTGPKRSYTLNEPVISVSEKAMEICPRLAMEGFSSRALDGMTSSDKFVSNFDMWLQQLKPGYRFQPPAMD